MIKGKLPVKVCLYSGVVIQILTVGYFKYAEPTYSPLPHKVSNYTLLIKNPETTFKRIYYGTKELHQNHRANPLNNSAGLVKAVSLLATSMLGIVGLSKLLADVSENSEKE